MSPGRLIVWFAAAAMLAGCGGNGPPSEPLPGPGGGETITGRERLGWTQPAADAGELRSLRYAIYVDGARGEASDASCGASSDGSGFPCSARLPAMTPGSHTLELAAFVVEDGSVVESPRSVPLRVTVSGSTAPADSDGSAPGFETLTTADGLDLAVEPVANGLDRPADIAFMPGGGVLVAELGGGIRFIRPTDAAVETAAVLDDVLVLGEAGGVLGIALHPDFERTGFVYVLHAAPARSGVAVFRLVRFRHAGGTLGQRAVLLDDVPAAADAAGAVRFGPDGKLYVALGGGDAPVDSEPLSSPNGKVLRLNDDGTTPVDQPSASPVHVTGAHAPRGMDWHPSDGSLWVLDGDDRGGARVSTAVRRPRAARASLTWSYALPPESGASSLAFYRSTAIPAFHGNVFVAARNTGLLRLQSDARDRRRIASTERLLADRPDGLRTVAVSPDGAIYAGTNTSLLRLSALR